MTTHPPGTRGDGWMEGFLARQRARKADSLLPDELRGGHLVDVGCGSHPLFLLSARFARKTGLDQLATDGPTGDVALLRFDAEAGMPLPFPDHSLDAVTLLAVAEHLRPETLARLLADVRRALAPAGMLVLTTPASWTGPVLAALSAIGALSREEIGEHKRLYRRREIVELLVRAGFARDRVESGSFECGVNLWARARA